LPESLCFACHPLWLNLGAEVEHTPGRLVTKDITPDQECIGVLGQFQWAATLGALVVGYLRRVATTDKGRDCNESCAACCVTIRLGTRGDLSYNLGQVRAD